MADDLPAGFVSFRVDRALVVCMTYVADAFREALRRETLFDYATHHPAARALHGRGVVWAVALPGDVERVVIRRNRHGGMFGGLLGDRFIPPTRAAHELYVSERLHDADVPTPRMLGNVTYTAPAGLVRVDVVSREVPRSRDLGVPLLSTDAAERRGALRSTARLLRALSHAGAWHQDLNVKNVLLRPDGGAQTTALALDVDRVVFADDRRDVAERNLARLLRSLEKWRARHGARVTEDEIAAFAAQARDVA